ncbi:hypothetical protein FA15DRAFT_679020 [Coprinopsis marcescibilis]|uniref:Methyltransferase type 11 domain-containing protein n=1 Tax=Coprinopsis marcescibilis TaxID=230819 RepID=A0A5C3L2Y8_COPMA|nr:hypothetical protein FA15DRAFT_679020 [Coprinopsis marcescibilis]
MAPKVVKTVSVETNNPHEFEDKNVHEVYDAIASHFSSTRYKPWPIIAAFLSNIPTGWVGLDSGTGNGKYLPLPLERPAAIWTIGLDRSINLLQLARTAGSDNVLREVVLGNVLDHCWRTGAFDYAISIATIHHLATNERRQLAVQVKTYALNASERTDRSTLKRLIQSVAPDHGRVLIYVWAIEQDELSKRAIPTEEQDVGEVQGKDVMVPWVLNTAGSPSDGDKKHSEVFNRYYHMFANGELSALTMAAARSIGLIVGSKPTSDQTGSSEGVEIVQDGWERSNYYVELRRWKI